MTHENQIALILAQQNVLQGKQLAEITEAARKQNKTLIRYLVDQKILTENAIFEALGRHLKVPFVDLQAQKIPDDVLNILPEPIAQTQQMVAFEKNDDNTLSVAMLDPDDIQVIDFIERRLGFKVKPFICTPSALRNALNTYHQGLENTFAEISEKISPQFRVLTETTDVTKSEQNSKEEGDPRKLKKLSEDLPVIRIVNSLLDYAVFGQASDIHIEPTEKDVIIRFRVDGILQDVMTLPKSVRDGIIARIKVLAKLKLDEHRLPQDGRFKIETKKYKISFRVSVIPVYDGEKMVLRVLNESNRVLTLEEIGLQLGPAHVLENNIRRPHGMVLVTGPTGSGKTTTLYTLINLVNSPKVNISTVEDPIEYRIERVNQTQVNPRIEFTFALGLRSLLRQDPDIIMVGEIRDKETAKIATNAAMTGHLLFSTLHTNDAVGSLLRLQQMDVPAFLVASTTNVIVAQRLVRKLCKDCKEGYKPDQAMANKIKTQFDEKLILEAVQKESAKKIHSLADMTFYRAKGCDACDKDGYKGRIGIFEVLENTHSISQLILSGANTPQLFEAAKKEGMITMLQDAFIKAQRGTTSIEEIFRVTKE
ncbi:MAG: hypothetical protein A3F54_02105 [Candidatus Kerfeldbacteria bacterium RIFCSPHIGHO2_12_FULL_48_17]|uniref:Bacterial type II secretion system protein E domain-containing protein n=1 Tax=Candidatus Kerfeldbacteria bacterium RIFCSPHIGHO2_12_FULL_48_17 TaxID=1798542 RepID=A0A1G2AX00_9BACT|nr:MAG: hypothetical protein A3F54_02105 [Candidatus Kerfeldbacteria bacterium RIFCSPHIGHO2_12_FULL_48_17]